MNLAQGEEEGELMPGIAWEGGLGSGPQDKDSDWWSLGTEAFDTFAGSIENGVKGISER